MGGILVPAFFWELWFYHNSAVSRFLMGWCAVVKKSADNGAEAIHSCLLTLRLNIVVKNKLTMVSRGVNSYLPRFTSSYGQNVLPTQMIGISTSPTLRKRFLSKRMLKAPRETGQQKTWQSVWKSNLQQFGDSQELRHRLVAQFWRWKAKHEESADETTPRKYPSREGFTVCRFRCY